MEANHACQSTDKYLLIQSWSRLVDCILHDVTTPLVIMRLSIHQIKEAFNELKQIYEQAIVQQSLEDNSTRKRKINLAEKCLNELPEEITEIFEYKKAVYDLKASAINEKELTTISINEYITESIKQYPFAPDEKNKIHIDIKEDFNIYGHRYFLINLLQHLVNNSLRSLTQKGSGQIEIWTEISEKDNQLHFKDTGKGISETNMKVLYQRFFSKRNGELVPGLGFCRFALLHFGSNITCTTQLDEYTHFVLSFSKV